VDISPEMRIPPSDGVLVKNPQTQFEVWFSGNVDYGICTYEQEIDCGKTFDINMRCIDLNVFLSYGVASFA